MSVPPGEPKKTEDNGQVPREPIEKDEVTILREIVRIFELESAKNELTAQRFRELSESRFYPLAVLLLKGDNVIERYVRRRRAGLPLPSDAAPEPGPSTGDEFENRTPASTPFDVKHERRIQRWAILAFKGVRLLRHAIGTLAQGNRAAISSPEREINEYGAWVEAFMTPDPGQEKHLRRRIGLLTYQPLLSIVMAAYNTNHQFLREAIESVLAQHYTNFELLIADDCSPDAEVRAIVEEYAKRDPRVRLIARHVNGGISAATNSAIDSAVGEWVVFMDHDDAIVKHALLHLVLAMNQRPSAALVYSDEDKIDEANHQFMPYFKSDFDPVLLLGQNYVCHLTTVRRSLVGELGGLRSEFDGSQDWDLVLRVSEVVDRRDIVHVPHVLYHWRSHSESTSKSSEAKPWALDAGRRAVGAALERRGVRASVGEIATTGFVQVHYELPEDPPLVSIIIPTRDGKFLAQCVTTVLERTTYPNYELVIIDNGSEKASTAKFFAGLGDRVRVLRDDSPFNYSALHNRAVPDCRGDVLLLLNDDTEILHGGWLTAMVAHLLQPGVGAVGAKLLYSDGRIQHAGVLLGVHGLAAHVARFHSSQDMGYFGRTALATEFQACTAACLAVRRTTWEKAGGLDERLEVAWNDIDFCLRVRENGEQIVYTPLAELIHHESVSRGLDETGPEWARFVEEVMMMRRTWGAQIALDPYYNPNLGLSHALFQLAYPPRVLPWYTGIE